MNKTVLAGVCLVTAFAVGLPSAFADFHKRKRRPSFLESLFGTFEGNSRDRRFKRERRAWWDEDDSIRIIREPNRTAKKKKRLAQAAKKAAPATAFVDPEEAQGFGMGNLTYALPKLVPVVDSTFAKLQTTETGHSAIRLALADRASNVSATSELRKVVLDHYKSTGFKPMWTENGKLTERGESLLRQLSQAAAEGLEAERYLPAVLASFADPGLQVAGDSFAVAQLDIGLTVAALTYARHISGGAFEPERLSKYHDIKPPYVNPEVALKVLAYSPFPASYLQSLAPTHPSYAALKAELATLANANVEDKSFPEGKRVKVAQKDPRIVLLRERLAAEGFVPSNAAEISADNIETLDKHLSKVLKAFQKSKGIAQTGHLDPATVRALSGENLESARERLMANLERLRWLPRDLGSRHVFVNQAAFTVDVMDGRKSVWNSKVIVGRPLTQTAVFSDVMETVVFNPTWGVPPSIILKEYLPKLRRDPSYLDKKGFQVVSLSGKPMKSSAINWNSVGSGNVPGVMQPAGGDNALGEIKFLFPNHHAIYMHDTPNRELFGEDRRAFSHGCVRVENPREFAEILLNWDDEKVTGRIDSGKTSAVKLEDKVRVHLTYFTAWPDESGKMQYFSDIYERDQTLIKALRMANAQFSRKKPQRLVQNVEPAAAPGAID